MESDAFDAVGLALKLGEHLERHDDGRSCRMQATARAGPLSLSSRFRVRPNL